MKLPPFKAWPQRPPMWAWPVVNLGFSPGIWATPKVTKDFGYVFIDLGPFAIELDGREYVKWITDVILPEGESLKDMPKDVTYRIEDGCVMVFPEEG
jgi:hypothetical protein